ncbi:MAG: hypothetical protein WBA39_31900 [Rivularia sp. (in: cyanobacteria)]
MGLTELAQAASAAVIWILDKTAGGALQQVGVKIFEFLKIRFKGKLELEQAKENPELLNALIITEAVTDNEFKESLEQLVIKFEQVKQQSSAEVQNTAEDVKIRIENVTGSAVLGQGQQTNNFRK